jgi:hypothetical protein
MVDVAEIEPATPACKAGQEIKSKSLFRLRLTPRFHQNDYPLVAPKVLQEPDPQILTGTSGNHVPSTFGDFDSQLRRPAGYCLGLRL